MCATNTPMNPEQKPDITLCDYVASITPSEKQQFYEEVYQTYVERLYKKGEPHMLAAIKDYEEMLNKKGTEILLLLFKRIVPTLDKYDKTPFILLYYGLKDACDGHEIDRLCTFLQIAGFRWSKIEKSFSTSSNTRNWRKGNKWIKTPEGKLLNSLFAKARQEANGEYKVESFNDIYLASILPELIKNKKVLFDVYQSFIEYRENEINKAINSPNAHIEKRKEEIRIIEEEISNIKSIYKEKCSSDEKKKKIYRIISENTSIQDHFQYEYHNYCKNEEYIFFKSANRSFYLSELEETLWKKLDPWPDPAIVLHRYYPHHLDVLEFSVSKKESLDFLKKGMTIETPSSNDNISSAK